MAESFLRMARKWLEGAAGLRQEAMTQSFTKSAGKRADELIGGSLNLKDIFYSRLRRLQRNGKENRNE